MKAKHSFAALLLCAAVAAGAVPSTVLAAGVNARDLRNALIGTSGMSADMDVNKDGKVNAIDLTLVKREALGLGSSSSGDIKDFGTKPDTSATMFANFKAGEAGDFFASDGWTNKKPFDCFWYKKNAQIKGDHLELTIDEKWNASDGNDAEWTPNYSGGEFRTNEFYHYGYYETSMQAIKNDGVVSSFFTYTGPSDVVNGQKNPWDEIDIEILGKDTTKVQLNYYRNGQGGHEKMIDLGFDASEGYHTYGFKWEPGKITWYVDGKEIWSMSGDVPVTPSKIMMNAWPGKTVDDWLNPYNGNKPLTARYQWVTFKAADGSSSTTTTPSNPTNPTNPSGNIPDLGTKMNANATMVSNFSAGQAGDFFASDGWTNKKPFDCYWYKKNAQIKGDHLELSIDEKWNASDGNDADWTPNYSGGEFRTNEFYHYGYYETSMQAIKNDGVVSSFFTYTGPSDVVNGQKNPWDEIDIEILGKDTTKVQLNYYRNGQGGHEKMIDLGFDASEAYHTYGFDWQPGKITWYVDGKEIWSMSGDVPVTPSKIMMNAWPGKTVDDWLNPYNGNKPLIARYQWVTYNQSSAAQSGGQQSGGQQSSTSGMNANATMVSNFSAGQAGDFFASDGWTNKKPFDCFWYKRNAYIQDGLLHLVIDQKWNASDGNDTEWTPNYSGGEFRTNDFYHYGYYETSMKAIKNDGVVSSFFTYTGPSDVVNGQKNPWDEIDIEILGKDTTKVQLNYYRNGQGGHEKMIDLGFDSSEAFHRYGFDWQPGKITWYVDGKEVWSMSGDVPVTPSKIMMNAWPGKTVDDWLKAYNGKTPLTAYYEWVTYNKQ